MRHALDLVLRAAVASGVTPGGVVAVASGERPLDIVPFGRTHHASLGAGSAVTEDTIYDIASLTKPVSALGLVMRLIELGKLTLDAAVCSLLPELVSRGAEGISLAHMIGHSAGFPDHVPFYQRLWAGERAGAGSAREALVRMAGATELISPPGTATRYSDVGYILLGAALERAGGARLDALADMLVFQPLGMTATAYVDLERPPQSRGTVAPTEVCPHRGLVHGEVHDENAHAAGGVCGHAGLFSRAADLSRFADAVSSALRGEASIFSSPVARFLATTPSTPGSSWRLGWDTPAREPGASQAGDLWPRDGVGHLAFTGCSIWLDPPRRRHVILLTNRVHPSRAGTGIRELRRAVMDTVVAALDGR